MNDVIGYIRVILPRYALAGQKEAMERHGIEKYLVEGGRKPKPTGTRQDVTRMMTEGRTLAIQHLFLLADPAKRANMRRDLWRAIDEVEKRKGVIWELYTGLRSDDRKQRDEMMRNAVEALARGRHKRSAADKRGRPKKDFTPLQIEKAQQIWQSRRLKTWAAVKEQLPPGFTLARAYKLWGPRNE